VKEERVEKEEENALENIENKYIKLI